MPTIKFLIKALAHFSFACQLRARARRDFVRRATHSKHLLATRYVSPASLLCACEYDSGLSLAVLFHLLILLAQRALALIFAQVEVVA